MASNENKKEKLIEMKNLKKYFPMKKRQVLKAVENVTMDIYKGEILPEAKKAPQNKREGSAK